MRVCCLMIFKYTEIVCRKPHDASATVHKDSQLKASVPGYKHTESYMYDFSTYNAFYLQVEVGKTTYKVTKLVAYDGTKYVTYYPAHMTFNPWSGTDAGYRAIAEYLLNTYK